MTLPDLSEQRPSALSLWAAALTPIASIALAALLTGMSAVTVVVAFVAIVSAMVAARTFVMSWESARGRSKLRSTFVLWLQEDETPTWLQRWYTPVLAAAGGGAAAEMARLAVALLGFNLDVHSVLGAVGIGALEGVLVALVFYAGYGLASYVPIKWRDVQPN